MVKEREGKEMEQVFLPKAINEIRTNNANKTAPTTLQAGMTWYDTTNKVLKIYNGSSWETFSFNTHTHSYVPITRTINDKALSSNITLSASDVGASASDHTHNYAGSSSVGGAATSANKVNASITFNNSGSGLASGTTFDGSAAKTISYNTIGAAASSHTHNYAGSSSAGGVATSANKVNTSITFNNSGNGALSGTTFDGSTAKTISYNTVGAAASSHTHDDRYYTESEIDSKLGGKANSSHGNHVPATETANNAKFLRNDNTWQTVTAANIGAAASSHTHNYAGSSSAGGAATSANKVNTSITFNNSGTGASSGAAFDGSAAKTISYNTIGAAASNHTHNYAGSDSAGGVANSATKLNTSRTIFGYEFDGTADINIKSDIEGTAIEDGMVPKVSLQDKGLLAGPIVREVRAAGNSTDIQNLSKIPLSTKEIFDNWNRISWNGSQLQNRIDDISTDGQTSARTYYSFNETTQCIVAEKNSAAWSAFISNDEYSPDYSFTTLIPGKTYENSKMYDNDDDIIFVVVGYMVDSNGKFHLITVERAGNGAPNLNNQTSQERYGKPLAQLTDDDKHDYYSARPEFAIYYDRANPVSFKLEEERLKPIKWKGSDVLLKVTKSNGKIVAECTEANSTSFTHKLTYTLPSTKPADWTEEQYNNIKKMMTEPSKIGFGTESNPSGFMLKEATGSVNVVTVYNMKTGAKETYDLNTSPPTKTSTTDKTILRPGTFIYSSLNNKLFFVKGWGKATEIDQNNNIIESKYNDDGSWYRKWSDGFIEQGGTYTKQASFGFSGATVTFIKAFTSTKYTLICNHTVTTTSLTSFYCNENEKNSFTVIWRACGK